MTALIGAMVTNTYTQAEMTASGVGFAVGDKYCAFDGKEYVFVQASSAVAANDTVIFTATETVAPLGTANDVLGARVGVAGVAIAASSFGWVQVYGRATARSAAAVAANARLNTTGTAGAVDDDATAGSMPILGMSTTAGNGSATTLAVILTNPTIGQVAL